jgi:hypothetical protein
MILFNGLLLLTLYIIYTFRAKILASYQVYFTKPGLQPIHNV